jgi:FtsP/CotA-like multicopper oxidase with cupredoxin domain
MRAFIRIAMILFLLQLGVVSLCAQLPNCPLRPDPGTLVRNPLNLSSGNGVLNVDLTLRNGVDQYGFMHYCYDYASDVSPGPGIEAPTLRLYPGDHLVLNLTNRIQPHPPDGGNLTGGMEAGAGASGGDPCTTEAMGPTVTNVHFHGLSIPPVCHQDDVINTAIQSGDAPFQYKIQIPENEPPGLYWYHPHPHGYTTTQVEGGASGALIVEGIEKLRPEVAGLQERVLILRQQFYNANSWIPGPFQFTVNFQTSQPELYPLPVIGMVPNKKEFWRFLNSSGQAFVSLQVQYAGVAQPIELIEIDGVPIVTPRYVTSFRVPPAGRVEFIVPGLPAGETGQLVTTGVYTGKLGNANPAAQLANIMPLGSENGTDALPSSSHPLPAVPPRFSGLETAVPTAKRKLYFSEIFVTPTVVKYLITVEGQIPKSYTPDEPPAIVTNVGAVEDWTVENRAAEVHAFHMHQLHFLVMAENGHPALNPALQDTVIVPAWDGQGPYPSVTLRMDFRDPEIAGTFLYHCHITDHEDGGMMAKILVKPAGDEGQAAASSGLPKAKLAKNKVRQSGL